LGTFPAAQYLHIDPSLPSQTCSGSGHFLHCRSYSSVLALLTYSPPLQGLSVGALVGEIVVGRYEGAVVGETVGTFVGFSVGAEVGRAVGTGVGLAVIEVPELKIPTFSWMARLRS
jgi:hypothetical protein